MVLGRPVARRQAERGSPGGICAGADAATMIAVHAAVRISRPNTRSAPCAPPLRYTNLIVIGSSEFGEPFESVAKLHR